MNAIFRAHPRRRSALLAALAAALTIGLAACYPGGPESLGELNTVVTVKNPNGNNTGMQYYAMVDTVYEIDRDDSSSDVLDRKLDATIIAEINNQMVAAGFTRVDTSATDQIDAFVTVGSVVSEVWVYWYNWGYYPGYPGYPGYYPPSVGTASFEQGSGNSAVAWEGVLRGRAQCFVAGADEARTGSRCIATRGTFAGPGTVSGWYLSGGTAELINPAGDGSTEGLAVDAGENCLRISDDPAAGWDAMGLIST